MELPAFSNTPALHRAGWIVLLTVATIAGSFVFACATPFPALAALAALRMKRRDAFLLTGIIWASNQVIGYGFLGYPHSWDSIGWGLAIGVAAATAAAAAIGAETIVRRAGWMPAMLATFVSAFAAYELTLYAATMVLPGDDSAFGVPVVLYVLEVNAVAFVGLLILHYLGQKLGLAATRRRAGRIVAA